MEAVKELFPSIYRITFPYKDIFTTVTVIRTPKGDAVVDCASYDEDMDQILFPALEALGVTEESLSYMVITHNHKDHAGGLGRFLQQFPKVCVVCGSDSLRETHPQASVRVVTEGEMLLETLRVTRIPGHTKDALALLDTRSGTLVCGDCLQQYGIFGSGKWGSNIRWPALHLEAVQRLRTLPIKGILSAHDFHPVGFMAATKEEATAFLDACADSLLRIRSHLEASPSLSDEKLAESYNAPGTLPTVGAHVFAALRRDFHL